MPAYYYDSCIFGGSLNPTAPEHNHCVRISAPVNISWGVCLYQDLVEAESTYGEYVRYFVVQCAQQGVELHLRNASDASNGAKTNRKHKRPLAALGLSSNDWRHLAAALSLPCSQLVSIDQDFRDPKAKAANTRKEPVKDYLEAHLAIRVVWPSEIR